MGGGMRALKIVTIAMGVLIVLGTTVVVITVIRRVTSEREVVSAPASAAPYTVGLREPEGTEIVSAATAGGRVTLLLRGGGPDRVVVLDAGSGAVVGRITTGR